MHIIYSYVEKKDVSWYIFDLWRTRFNILKTIGIDHASILMASTKLKNWEEKKTCKNWHAGFVIAPRS